MTNREIQERFEKSTVWECWCNDNDYYAQYRNSDATAVVTFWTTDSKNLYIELSIANVFVKSTIKASDCRFANGLLMFDYCALYLGDDTQEIPF